MADNFAFVVDPSEMTRLGFLPRWGILRDRSGQREVYFPDRLEDVLKYVEGLPIVPARDDHYSVVLPYAEEMQIISDILDNAPEALPTTRQVDDTPEVMAPTEGCEDDFEVHEDLFNFPSGFSRIFDVGTAGLNVTPGDEGLDIEISDVLGNALGWTAGDRIALAIDGSGRRIAIAKAPDGSILVSESGHLESSTTLPFPSWLLSLKRGESVSPRFERHARAIVVDLHSFRPAARDRSAARGRSRAAMRREGVGAFLLFAALALYLATQL